jgi:polysaccharide deacetylase 2 family uncharacterized protein YibQ
VTGVRVPLATNYSSSSSPKRNSRLFATFFVVLAALFGVIAGCKKSEPARLPFFKIHAITRELSDAARSAAPRGTEIHTVVQPSEGNPEATDRLDIRLPSSAASSSERADVAKIQQALGAVATRNGLTEKPSESREGILFFYLKGGIATHAVHIHIGSNLTRKETNAQASHGPELAIILDDLGNDRAAAEAIFALPYPLTISVLPNHEHSAEITSEALRRGYQVMLHLPMQSVGNERPETQELRPGMPAAEIATTVEQFLETVPGAVGVNNHQGSQATSDSQLMSELMPILSGHHLFYVDSRTTAATVAYDTAQNLGVRSAYRNVPFLDDVTEVAAVRKQIELALRGAREKGEAVAIGHPHRATLKALREVLPQAQVQGVHLVFVSELVH